jgi:predicted phosphoribosyltransferase
MAYSAVVLSTEVSHLRAANALLSKRKERKQKVLKGAITILVADGLEIGSQLATAQSVIASDGSTP